jgi:hypothetical protein
MCWPIGLAYFNATSVYGQVAPLLFGPMRG